MKEEISNIQREMVLPRVSFPSFSCVVLHCWPRKFSIVHLSSNPISSACELLCQAMCRRSSGMSLCSCCQRCDEASNLWHRDAAGKETSQFPHYWSSSTTRLRQKMAGGLSSVQDLFTHLSVQRIKSDSLQRAFGFPNIHFSRPLQIKSGSPTLVSRLNIRVEK